MKQLIIGFIFLGAGGLLLGCYPPQKINRPFITKKPAPETKNTTPEKSTPEHPPSENIRSKKKPTKNLETRKPEIKKLETETKPPKKIEEITVILSYFRFLDSLPKKALKQEHARTKKEFSENQNPLNRLRLAMLLSLTTPGYRDYDHALTLLNKYLDNPDAHDPMLRDFSFLLSSVIQKLNSREQQLKKRSQTLKKEQRQNKRLKKMIEELKAIEKSLMKRDETKRGE